MFKQTLFCYNIFCFSLFSFYNIKHSSLGAIMPPGCRRVFGSYSSKREEFSEETSAREVTSPNYEI